MTLTGSPTYNDPMLRIAVIFLFITNLALVGFQVSRPVRLNEAETVTPQEADPDIPTIYLFSELMQDQDLMSENRHCYTVGPFYSKGEMEQARERLGGATVSTAERETLALVEKGYWVFMPPYVSLLEANRALFSLQALGLEDIAIIYEGEMKNAISLGYFLRQKNAIRRKADLEARGFEAQVRVKRQNEPRYWLDYEQNPGSEMPVFDMHDLPNDFMQRWSPCPERGLPDTATGVLQAEAEEGAPLQAGTTGETGEPLPEDG